MKKFMSLIMAVFVFCLGITEFSVNATDNPEEEQPTFVYTVKDDGTAEITAWFLNEYNAYIPPEVDGYTVTSIGDFAFYGLSEVKLVYIPYSVTEIGEGAFLNCENMDSVVISDSVESIGELAFGCIYDEETETAYKAEKFTVYGYHGFEGVSKAYADSLGFEYNGVNSLIHYSKYKDEIIIDSADPRITKINIPAEINGMPVVKIQSMAFENYYYLESVVLPDSLKEIGVAAFSNCSLITEIDIPDSVSEIGVKAFMDCISLEKVKLPAELEVIGESLFSGCISLSDITLGEKITNIEQYAFSKCYSIEEITIPASVKTIGDCAFSGCISLKNINVDPENQKYYSKDGVLLSVTHWVGGNDTYTLECFPCDNPATSYTVPEEVSKIAKNAFYECQNLESVVITENVQQIGSFAFADSESLRYIEHPASAWLTEAGNYRNCPNLTVYAEESERFNEYLEKENNTTTNIKVLSGKEFDIIHLKGVILNISEAPQDSEIDIFDLIIMKHAVCNGNL